MVTWPYLDAGEAGKWSSGNNFHDRRGGKTVSATLNPATPYRDARFCEHLEESAVSRLALHPPCPA